MQSTALAPRLRRNASRAIAHPPGARLYRGAPPASSGVQSGPESKLRRGGPSCGTSRVGRKPIRR